MEIIAIACEGELISRHFGYCRNFNLYSIDNGKIINKVKIDNPGHKPGYLPVFLNDLQVNILITGGIGSGAISIFNDKDIKVYSGAGGNSDKAIENYLNGTLESTGSICHDHSYHN